MADKQETALRILNYWYIIESFAQHDLPSKEHIIGSSYYSDGLLDTCDICITDKSYIRPEGSFSSIAALISSFNNIRCNNTKREVVFFCGSIRRQYIAECFRAYFHEGTETDTARVEKTPDNIALFTFRCDSSGRYVKGSFHISPIIYYAHILMSLFVERNTSIDNIACRFSKNKISAQRDNLEKTYFYTSSTSSTASEPIIVTPNIIAQLAAQIQKEYLDKIIMYHSTQGSAYDLTSNNRACVVCYDSSRKEILFDVQCSDDLCSSHILRDLHELRFCIRKQNFLSTDIGKAVVDYIASVYATEQDDLHNWVGTSDFVRSDVNPKSIELQFEKFREYLDVLKAPLGRWPSKFMPSLMQQVAINLSWNPDKSLPIFSINGPPGTGKTTLLKDVIVGNIVERAYLLCECESPDEIFEKSTLTAKSHITYYRFRSSEIKRYGMIVASCNNTAVENITKELPGEKDLLEQIDSLPEIRTLFKVDRAAAIKHKAAVDEGFLLSPLDAPDVYFTSIANNLVEIDTPDRWKCWGLISAPMGKLKNKKDFYTRVIKSYLDTYGSIDVGIERFRQAKIKYLEQRERVLVIRHRLQEYSQAEVEYTRTETQLNDEIKRLSFAESEIHAIIEKLKTAETESCYVTSSLRQLESEVSIIEIIKNFLYKIMTGQETYNFQQRRELSDRLHKAKNTERLLVSDAVETLNRLCNLIGEPATHYSLMKISSYAQAIDELTLFQEHLADAQTRCKEFMCVAVNKRDRLLEEAHSKGAVVLDKDFVRAYRSESPDISVTVQKLVPWFTQEYNREREKLFYYALQVHKEFLLASKCCFSNFRLLLDLEGFSEGCRKVSLYGSDASEKSALYGSLLNTVLLLTPVLSTTFASVEKFLSSITTQGELGCLIIDEAGQAPPEMALGALYRFQRAIVVGDPKQIQPVVTDKLKWLKELISNDDRVLCQQDMLSVQSLADNINTIGTYNICKGQTQWVGCPLTVHRRCISPMFDISNKLSYGGSMRNDTVAPDDKLTATFCYSKSWWFDIRGEEVGGESKSHYVPDQGEKVYELILQSLHKSNNVPKLYIITPFRSVKNGIVRLIKSKPEYKTNANLRMFVSQNIGTVHTFQGKGTNEVIFVLGCSDTAKPAVSWVTDNLVNVAVTRAKYRLYVIGDRDLWESNPAVRVVSDFVPKYEETTEVISR